MMSFPQEDLVCPDWSGYSVGRASSFSRVNIHDGRPRYRLQDTAPTYSVSFVLDLTLSKFALWQSFWSSLRGGADWFEMDLAVRGGIEKCLCHATGPYNASFMRGNSWQVSVSLEVVPAA